MSKTRKYHKLPYYEAAMSKASSMAELDSILDDAAHMPLSVLDEAEYEKIFWQAMRLSEGR